MGTLRKKYNSYKKTKKGGKMEVPIDAVLSSFTPSKIVLSSNTEKISLSNTVKNAEEVSFLDILKSKNVDLFDGTKPEIKLNDLGITVKQLSEAAQKIYKETVLFPLTIFYYENDDESRNFLGLNYSEMKSVTVNNLLTTSNVFQCTDISEENLNYTEEKIKDQDSKPIVIGSNIFKETPESVNLNNLDSLFNKAVFDISKEDSSVRKNFVRQARLKKYDQTAGANVAVISTTRETTSFSNKLEGLYWFSTHRFDNITKKVEQFINYYMFSQNYQYNITDNTINQSGTRVSNDSAANVLVISDHNRIISAQSTPTQLYSGMPGWVKARGFGYGLGSIFSALSYITFGSLAIDTVSAAAATQVKSITYGQLNSTAPGVMNTRTYIVSAIDKKHLLYSIFLKILVEIAEVDFKDLCRILEIDEDDTNVLNENRVKIRPSLNEIPYNLFMENLYLNRGRNKVDIQTVLNTTGNYELFIELTPPPVTTERDCEPIWNRCLARLFFYFNYGTLTDYNVSATYYSFKSQFRSTTGIVPRGCGSVIRSGDDYSNGNILRYSYIDIAPPVTFTPEPYSIGGTNYPASRKSGYGNITDGKRIKWFYDTANKVVTNGNDDTRAEYESEASWASVGTTGTVLSTVNSRITDFRSCLLCYLSELIYSPNDIVKKVSDTMFGAAEPVNKDNSRIIYIGNYDDDPSYPYAFDSADNDNLKPSYSRIHAWLYINNNYVLTTATPINVPALELFIVNRGSKTALDWEDIDKSISEGTALYNDRPLSYSKILYQILNDLDGRFDAITQFMKPSSNLDSGSGGLSSYSRNLQIIASGHSLGGFLGLYFSFMSLSRNVIENFTSVNQKIKGARSRSRGQATQSTQSTWIVNRYILPTVFQPYIKTQTIIETYNKIPCGIVNTVSIPNDYISMATSTQYVDAASNDFFHYIEKNPGGGLKVCKYENVYLDRKITSIHDSLFNMFNIKDRITDIMVNAHALWQMSGLCLKYYAEHVNTDFYIKAKIGENERNQNLEENERNQNLEVTKYQFNFDDDCIQYSQTNQEGQIFTTNQAMENIRRNIGLFLTNPNDGVDVPINRIGGKILKKNITRRKINRKSKRKTQKIRKNRRRH